MLLNLHKKKWADGLTIKPFDKHSEANQTVVSAMQELADSYEKAVVEEDRLTAEALAIANVGRQVRPPCRSPPSHHAVTGASSARTRSASKLAVFVHSRLP
jgi:hypothetical protein